MKQRLVLIAVVPVLIIFAGLSALVGSEAGSRWLLRQVFSNPAIAISVEAIQGSLLDRIELTGLRYNSDTETVAIKHVVFAWRAGELLFGTLKIVDLSIDGLAVNTRTAGDRKKSNLDLDAGLSMPVQLVVERLLLTDMRLGIDDQVYGIKKLYVSAASDNNRLNIHTLTINSREITASIQGQVGLSAGFPLNLQSEWQVNTDGYGLWQGATAINGDLHNLSFDKHLSAPFKLALSGKLHNVLDTPRITVCGDWSRFRWPVTGATPEINSEQGHVELAGTLDDYRITVNGRLSQQYVPDAALSFNGKGGQTAMTIEKLALTSKTGLFELAGKVSWVDAPAFELTATGRDFNLGLLVPELPGNLTFSTHLKGRLDAKALQLDAEINRLSGRLRGYPVNAGGKLVLNGDRLKVDALRIASGANQLAVDGILGQEQAALKIAVDMPALDTLWPGLGGNLQGKGELQGLWKNPSVLFAAQAQHLRFAGYSAEQLAVDVDYRQGGQKTSSITLSADAVKTGSLDIAKARVDVRGTIAQHSVNADIITPHCDISAALTGRFGEHNWAGGLAKLELDSKDAGLWRLTPAGKNVAMRAGQKAAGFDMAFDSVCLARQSGSLCAEGRYAAGGDLEFKLTALDLPLSLVQAYVPGQLDLKNNRINGDVGIQRQNGVLSGHYRFTIPDKSSIRFKTRRASSDMIFDASSLSGRLNGNVLSADLDIALTGRDYCRAKLELDTGTQNLFGRITAFVSDAALIEPFMPQLSGIKGQVRTDLTLAGTVEKPLLNGTIDVAKAGADIDELGIELRDINLQASATGDNAGRIELKGSAKSGAGAVKLDGFLLLEAQSGWPVELMLTGENFEVARLPEAQIAVSPDLKIAYAGTRAKVSGQLKIPKAAIRLKQLPENAVKVSSDEVIIGAQPQVSQTSDIDADITVELGKDVSFSGQGLQSNLSGSVKIINAHGALTMQGTVDMNKASYKSYGQDLSVRKGRFIFNGPVDNPWLDVEATRLSKSQKVTAILNVTGPLKTPQTRISSEPAQAEADALAYLVTGRPLNQVSQSESNRVADAALSYGAGQVSWVAEQLGIDEFDVQEGETLKDTLVSVGQYLTPEFYVGTKVGLFNKQAVLVFKRKLTPTVNVETQTGTSQRIKLNYERDTE